MRRHASSLTLHQLDILAAVAREGSFTRAADALMLSAPAVSQQIALLERAVGVRLFDRTPRRPIGLTEAGRRLVGVSEELFRQLDAAVEEVKRMERARERRVDFGASKSFCSYVVPSLYASFRKVEPGTAVHVDMSSPPQRIEGLMRGLIDLAVLPEPDDGPLTKVLLAGRDKVLVGQAGHPLVGSGFSPFEAIVGEHLIVYDDESEQDQLSAMAAERGVTLDLAWSLRSVEAQINAVTNGLGIALVPYYVVASELAAGTLCLLNVEGFPIRTDWYLVWHPDRLSGPAATFRDHLLEHQADIERMLCCPDLTTQPESVRCT